MDILIEFKYIPLKDMDLTGEKIRSLSEEELKKIPVVSKQWQSSYDQIERYQKILSNKYKYLKLSSFRVVSIGFEKLLISVVK